MAPQVQEYKVLEEQLAEKENIIAQLKQQLVTEEGEADSLRRQIEEFSASNSDDAPESNECVFYYHVFFCVFVPFRVKNWLCVVQSVATLGWCPMVLLFRVH